MRGQQFSSQQPAVDDEANQVQSQNDSIIRRQPQPHFVPPVPIPHSRQQIQQQRTAEDDNHLWGQSQPNTMFVDQQFRRGPISSSYSRQNIIDNPSVENYDALQRAHSSTSSGIHRSQPLCIQSDQLQQRGLFRQQMHTYQPFQSHMQSHDINTTPSYRNPSFAHQLLRSQTQPRSQEMQNFMAVQDSSQYFQPQPAMYNLTSSSGQISPHIQLPLQDEQHFFSPLPSSVFSPLSLSLSPIRYDYEQTQQQQQPHCFINVSTETPSLRENRSQQRLPSFYSSEPAMLQGFYGSDGQNLFRSVQPQQNLPIVHKTATELNYNTIGLGPGNCQSLLNPSPSIHQTPLYSQYSAPMPTSAIMLTAANPTTLAAASVQVKVEQMSELCEVGTGADSKLSTQPQPQAHQEKQPKGKRNERKKFNPAVPIAHSTPKFSSVVDDKLFLTGGITKDSCLSSSSKNRNQNLAAPPSKQVQHQKVSGTHQPLPADGKFSMTASSSKKMTDCKRGKDSTKTTKISSNIGQSNVQRQPNEAAKSTEPATDSGTTKWSKWSSLYDVLESPERKKIEDICQPKQKPNDDSTERANILFSTPEHRKTESSSSQNTSPTLHTPRTLSRKQRVPGNIFFSSSPARSFVIKEHSPRSSSTESIRPKNIDGLLEIHFTGEQINQLPDRHQPLTALQLKADSNSQSVIESPRKRQAKAIAENFAEKQQTEADKTRKNQTLLSTSKFDSQNQSIEKSGFDSGIGTSSFLSSTLFSQTPDGSNENENNRFFRQQTEEVPPTYGNFLSNLDAYEHFNISGSRFVNDSLDEVGPFEQLSGPLETRLGIGLFNLTPLSTPKSKKSVKKSPIKEKLPKQRNRRSPQIQSVTATVRDEPTTSSLPICSPRRTSGGSGGKQRRSAKRRMPNVRQRWQHKRARTKPSSPSTKLAPKKTKIVRMAVNEFERRLNELQVAPILEPLNSETELEIEREVRAIRAYCRYNFDLQFGISAAQIELTQNACQHFERIKTRHCNLLASSKKRNKIFDKFD